MKKVNKKKSTSSNVIFEKCPVCGRQTSHYVDANGNVRCSVCQHIAKTIAVKEVEFEVDPEFDSELNPVSAEEPVAEGPVIEPTAEPIVDELP